MNPAARFRKVWYNGALCDRTDAEALGNRAFRYGDGLIETIRLMRGELLFYHDHVERLLHGMQALFMPVPSHWDARFFYDRVAHVLTANGVDAAARVRLQVWRTGDGLYNTNHQGVGLAAEVTEASDAYTFDNEGLTAHAVTSIKKIHDRTANVKTSSALAYVLAAMEARHNGADLGFVFNEHRCLADAPGRNVFVIENGRVITPPLTDACVAGVFRLQLLNLLRGHKIATAEESLTEERLRAADEIFVTNVVDGIQPVRMFSGNTYKTDQARELHKLFNNHLSHAGD